MADTAILSQTTVHLTLIDGMYMAAQAGWFSLQENSTYRVVWDTTEHTVKAYSYSLDGYDAIVLGNESVVKGENTELTEPFVIYQVITNNYCVISAPTDTEATSHKVAIYSVTEEDKEYLIWGSTLTGIADAIRAKNGTTGEIAVSDMAAKISAITGGGSGGSSDAEVVYVTFMSHDGATELYKRAVVPGNTCVDVVSFGLLETPIKESSTESTFTFSGWSLTGGGSADSAALLDVTENRVVYAADTTSVRSYTIRFWDGDTLLTTLNVNYGETPEYTAEKDGYRFDGWSPAISVVTGEADYYAQWIDLSQMVAYGTCGDNVSWTLDGNYVLTLSGTGATKTCDSIADIPWYSYRANVTQIIVGEGITTMGKNIFNGCTGATSISLPSTLERFEYQSCYNCSSLTEIVIPESVTYIGISALGSCSKVTSLVVPDRVSTIEMMAFSYCSELTSIVIGSGVTRIGSQTFTNCSKLASATFRVTSGWWVSQSSSATSGTSIAVTDPSAAATYLKSTYLQYHWNRS